MRSERPSFLTLDDVLALHAHQIAGYGGRLGLRDLRLLEAAVAIPRASFGGAYLHGTLEEMAAAYLFHLCRNHPFLDGNKRAALAAALLFLALNGVWIEAGEDELVDLVLGVARSRLHKADVAVFLRKHAKRRARR